MNLEEENKQLKDLVVNEVAARQQISGRLEQLTKEVRGLQAQFGQALQEIRKLAQNGNSAAVVEKVDVLIGVEPKNEVAPS